MSAAQLAILSTVLWWVVVPIAVFIGRHWFIARVTKGVEHGFNKEIEELRAELRRSEERYKSELRENEGEIAALRAAVLDGRAARRSLLDKRRFEAVEKVWTAVNDLGSLKGLSQTMALLNYDAVAKQTSDPKMQKVLATLSAGVPDTPDKLPNVARDEQPFISDLGWAYFEAYRSILYMNLARFMLLKFNVEEPQKLIAADKQKQLLKATLPQYEKFIDDNDPGAYHYLLEDVEKLLLAELKSILDGRTADEADAKRAREITETLRKIEDTNSEAAAIPSEFLRK